MARAKADAIDHLLAELWERKASDLLLTVGAPPLLRIDGVLVPMQGASVLKPEDTELLVNNVLSDDMRGRFQKEKDFSFNWRSVARFRGNAFFQRGSVSLAVRAIPFAIPSFAELGLPSITE